MKKLAIIGILLFLGLGLFKVQSQSYKFVKYEKMEKGKMVYFVLNNISSEIQKKNLYEDLVNDNKIIKVIIDNDNTCKAHVTDEVNADYILAIVHKHNADINYDCLEKVKPDCNTNQNIVKNKNLPDDFPKRGNSGDPRLDEEIYAKKIREWKKSNPERWQKILENRRK